MNAKYFAHKFCDILMNETNDHVFSNIKFYTGGGTSPRIAKTINFATALLEKGDAYVEVGVFRGFTLASASYGNTEPCYGIDNFDVAVIGPELVKEEVIAACKKNIESYPNSHITLIESDFRNVTKEDIKEKIGVLFIDAKHTFKDVIENLEWAEPLLADNAIIMFDDAALDEVDAAIKGWWMDHLKNYDLIFHARPIYTGEPHIPVYDRFLHNGLGILMYARKGFK